MSLPSSSKPIVHIATDEKFIDAAYEIYEEAFPGENRFLILLNENQDEIKHLSEKMPYEFFKSNDQLIPKVKDRIHEAEVVMFHEMNYYQMEIALSLVNQAVKLGWTVFGYEVYDNPYLFGNEIYGKRTYERFVMSHKSILKNKVRPYYHRLVRGQKDPFERRIQAMEQMDFVGILYKEELQLYKERMNLKEKVEQLKFTYYPLDVVVNKNAFITGNKVLIGNSASYSNNHLEAFNLLKELNIDDRQIVCPLSYGDEKYAAEIEKEGDKLFGSNFIPLTDFLPLIEYQEVLQSCGIVIMNHYRQQAVGNVLNTIYLGAKVFLSNKNTLYHYLKRRGCYVSCIETDLVPTNIDALTLLDKSQIQHNRKVLKEELSLERVCNELQQKLGPLLN